MEAGFRKAETKAQRGAFRPESFQSESESGRSVVDTQDHSRVQMNNRKIALLSLGSTLETAHKSVHDVQNYSLIY